MKKLFLLPGGLVCDAVDPTEDSDNRQILRMFLNTLIWGGGRSHRASILNPSRPWLLRLSETVQIALACTLRGVSQ